MTTQLYQHHRYPSRQQQQQQPITQSNHLEHSESEAEAESTGSDSDDSDDIPLGQRHPDALKAQATIRAERAKRRQQQQQEQELARAATIAKLSMKSTGVADEDDNQPLGLIKRMKSMAKPIKNNQLPPPSSTAFSVEELIKKLDLVQQQAIKPSVLIHNQQQQQQQLSSQTHTTQTINTHHTNIPQPRLAQLDTNSGSQSRKPSDHFLTPLSPSFQDHPQQLPLPIRRPSERTIPKSPIEQQRDLIDSSCHISPSVQQQQQATLLDNKSYSLPDQIRRSPIHHRGHTDQHTHHHHHEPTPSNALRRAKSTADKPGTFHSFHNAPPTEPLPTLPSHINQHPHHHHHHHHHQQQQQQPEPESRSPVLTRPTKLLSPIDTKLVGPLPGGSPMASPIETSSPSHPIPLKKILIKLAIVHQSQSIMVEIDPFTTVKDLLNQAQQTGELNDELSKGSWGVFEVWKDLGIGQSFIFLFFCLPLAHKKSTHIFSYCVCMQRDRSERSKPFSRLLRHGPQQIPTRRIS
jgi:hypothetical protein